ncbi:hypothetical protein OH77DRAFT_1397649 [Trametes cingulata]|nr:hypothetical protein OH77DRAFT_1397649 [Trametes cingulata]
MGPLPLPVEIFLTFRECIPLSDIRTHVCFYKTHPRIAALYDAEEKSDEFWRHLCWHSGITALYGDDLKDPGCWRRIAMEVVEKDGFCKHPQCGEGLLEYNRQRMVLAEKHVRSPLIYAFKQHGTAPATKGDDSSCLERLTMHRALSHLMFSPCSSGPTSGPYEGVGEEALLRPAAHEEGTYDGSIVLMDHPLIQRSFATDVPVGQLCLTRLVGPFGEDGVGRPSGISVLDVVELIHCGLDRDLGSSAMLLFLMTMFDSLDEDWPATIPSEQLRTIRGLLRVCHLAEYKYEGTLVRGTVPHFSVRLERN